MREANNRFSRTGQMPENLVNFFRAGMQEDDARAEQIERQIIEDFDEEQSISEDDLEQDEYAFPSDQEIVSNVMMPAFSVGYFVQTSTELVTSYFTDNNFTKQLVSQSLGVMTAALTAKLAAESRIVIRDQQPNPELADRARDVGWRSYVVAQAAIQTVRNLAP